MLKKTVPVLALVLCLMCSAAGLSEAFLCISGIAADEDGVSFLIP